MTGSLPSSKNEVLRKVMINFFLKKQKNCFFIQAVLVVIIFLVFFSFNSRGQNDSASDKSKDHSKTISDTSSIKRHDPKKATIYSMILPGLGQAYNKKYWKIPIVYTGFGVCYYFISFNNKEYKEWQEAYNHSLSDPDNTEPPVNEYEEMYGSNPQILKDQKDYYRRNRDLSYIFTGIWYLLNVVDAAVDAHLYSWEIDDDLSLRFEPTLTEPLYGYKPGGGLRLTLNFK